MPQAWSISRPWRCSNPSTTARGIAAPPTTRHAERGEVVGCPAPRRAPGAGPSRSSGRPRRSSPGGARRRRGARPGRGAGRGAPALAPTIAQVNGSPQAFAWNIGTTGSSASRCDTASVSAMAVASEWSDDRPVRVDDALRPSRRAARVTHRRGGALVDVGQRRLLVGLGREEILVLDRAVGRRPVADCDEVRDAGLARRTARRAATAPCPRSAPGRLHAAAM